MFTTFINNKFLLYLTLFGVALSLLLQFGVKPIVEGDAGSYIQCANAFYNGKPQECTPIRTPGYPLFILITNTIFQNLNYQLTVTIQYFLILGTAYYIYLLALLLFQNKTIGYVSYFLIITNPVFIFYSNNILTEITYIFFSTGFCYFTIKYIFKQDNINIILASVFIAISALIRPLAQYYYLFLLIILFFVHYKNWMILIKKCFLAVLLVYIIFSPWMIKNYLQFHRGSLTVVFGEALWTDVYRFNKLPLVDSNFYKKEKEEIRASSEDKQYLNAKTAIQSFGYDMSTTDNILKEISMESIKAYPIQYAKGVLASFINMAFYPKYIYGDYIAASQKTHIREYPPARYVYYAFDDLMHKLNYPSLFLTIFGIAGLYICFTSFDIKKKLSSIFFILIIFSSLAIASIIASYVRYRIIIDQFLILFSVFAFFHLWNRYGVSRHCRNFFHFSKNI